jgi:hypothetical protein
MNTKKNDAISFQITNVQVLDFSLTALPKALPPASKFQFDLSLAHQIDAANNTITVICRVLILNEIKDTQYAALSSACVFSVQNLSDFWNKKSGHSLPNDFIIQLNAISLSTTRGLISAQFKGTYLQNIVLPLINISIETE